MGLVRVVESNRASLEPGIVALEAGAEYPLGADFFKIDHGADYLAFFRRLGDVHYYAWLEGEGVAAVAAGILRATPAGRAWYLCDLKVRRESRGSRIPLKMLRGAFLWNYLRCARGYAISMNPSDGSPNRIARLLKHFRWAPARIAGELSLWSLSAAEMRIALPALARARGEVSFLSLGGVKDIVLRSTGAPMRLLHAQFGPLAEHTGPREPVEGAVHMFCAPRGDALGSELAALGFVPSATATIIAHRMERSDWRWVLTSEI
jgi:hypothetical protein